VDQLLYTEKESTCRRRPVLEQLLGDGTKRKFDVLLVWKLDRLGRAVAELVANIQALDRAGVRGMVYGQGIDTDQRSPVGKLMIHVLAAVAEFERDLISGNAAKALSGRDGDGHVSAFRCAQG